MDCAPRPRGGASALWDDLQALAALQSALGATQHRTRTHCPLPEPRRAALACQ
jgi:hypothetical protein